MCERAACDLCGVLIYVHGSKDNGFMWFGTGNIDGDILVVCHNCATETEKIPAFQAHIKCGNCGRDSIFDTDCHPSSVWDDETICLLYSYTEFSEFACKECFIRLEEIVDQNFNQCSSCGALADMADVSHSLIGLDEENLTEGLDPDLCNDCMHDAFDQRQEQRLVEREMDQETGWDPSNDDDPMGDEISSESYDD